LAVYGQSLPSGKVWYGVDYVGMMIDTASIKNSPRFLRSVIENINTSKRLLKPDISLYTLTFKGNNSRFKKIPRMEMGDEFMYLSSYTVVVESLKIGEKVYSPAMDNPIKGKNYYKLKPLDEESCDWQLKPEYKTILGYKCQKAVFTHSRQLKSGKKIN